MKCWMHLVNGWTVSISESDTPPALCSVAAWPSIYDSEVTTDMTVWFTFANGRQDQRCWCVEDIRKALVEVETAGKPE